MKKQNEFIVIDDDESANILNEIVIKRALGRDTEIQTFTLADNGINYLSKDSKPEFKTIMFLDINMPVTSGWEALNMLEKLDESIKKRLTVFMLSSSIDPHDKKRAAEHPLVFAFVEKPLTIEKVESAVSQVL